MIKQLVVGNKSLEYNCCSCHEYHFTDLITDESGHHTMNKDVFGKELNITEINILKLVNIATGIRIEKCDHEEGKYSKGYYTLIIETETSHYLIFIKQEVQKDV